MPVSLKAATSIALLTNMQVPAGGVGIIGVR